MGDGEKVKQCSPVASGLEAVLLCDQPSLTAVCDIVTKLNLLIRVHGHEFPSFFRVPQHFVTISRTAVRLGCCDSMLAF